MNPPSYYILEPCSTSNAFEARLDSRKIDVGKAASVLEKGGSLLGASDVLAQGAFRGFPVSVYGSGRIMIRGGDKKLTRHDADETAAELIALLDGEGALI